MACKGQGLSSPFASQFREWPSGCSGSLFGLKIALCLG
jgi:hypothetical protein